MLIIRVPLVALCLQTGFQFWTSRQLAHESVLDWEVRVRQSATLCEYREFADELCRDKFIFGLAKEGIRTELLKTHLAADKKPKITA